MARSEKRAVYSGTGTRTVACLACGVWVLWVTRPLHSLGLGSYSAGWGHHRRAMPGLFLHLLPRVLRTPARMLRRPPHGNTLHAPLPKEMQIPHSVYRTQMEYRSTRRGVDSKSEYFRGISVSYRPLVVNRGSGAMVIRTPTSSPGALRGLSEPN